MAHPTDWMPCPDLHVFTSRGKARRFAIEQTGKEPDLMPSSNAVTASLVEDGKSLCIVVVPKKDEFDKRQRVAILAHECVHVAQFWAECMGESKPGNEWMAYATQSAMLVALDQLGEKWL